MPDKQIPLFEKEGSGEILYDGALMTKKKLTVIGKPLRKIDAMAKCAGETVFADDLNLSLIGHSFELNECASN